MQLNVYKYNQQKDELEIEYLNTVIMSVCLLEVILKNVRHLLK